MEEDARKRLLSTTKGKLRAREKWQQEEEGADFPRSRKAHRERERPQK
jgi:hypothetical protein